MVKKDRDDGFILTEMPYDCLGLLDQPEDYYLTQVSSKGRVKILRLLLLDPLVAADEQRILNLIEGEDFSPDFRISYLLALFVMCEKRLLDELLILAESLHGDEGELERASGRVTEDWLLDQEVDKALHLLCHELT